MQLRNIVLAVHRNRVMEVIPQQLRQASRAEKTQHQTDLTTAKLLSSTWQT